ncbi:MAG: ABC transporter permease [Clostridia bacterium]
MPDFIIRFFEGVFSKSTAEQGLIYAVLALGLYISYSVLDFPDLSVDGTFPMGSAVTAVLIIAGVNPWLCLPIAFVCGAAAGMITGLIHVKLNVTNLLSGILMMTALYSINLTIAGRSNLALFSYPTIFNGSLAGIFPKSASKLVIIILCVAVVKILFDLYMKTKSGMILRACGANEQLVRSVNVDSGKVKMLGLAIADGLVALSGSMMCQYNMNFDITTGTGSMVIGLASVIIGTTVLRKVKFMKGTTKVIFGSIIYYMCISAALVIGLKPQLLKLIIAVLFLIILIFNNKIFKGGKADA